MSKYYGVGSFSAFFKLESWEPDRRNGRRSRQDYGSGLRTTYVLAVAWYGICVPGQVGMRIGVAVFFDVASMIWKRESFCKIQRCASQKLQLRSKHFLLEFQIKNHSRDFHVHQYPLPRARVCTRKESHVMASGTEKVSGMMCRVNRRAHQRAPRVALACEIFALFQLPEAQARHPRICIRCLVIVSNHIRRYLAIRARTLEQQ